MVLALVGCLIGGPVVAGCGAPGEGGPVTSPSGRAESASPGHASPGVSDLRDRWPSAQVIRAGEAVVVGARPEAELRDIAAAADEAWQRCRAVWPEQPPPPVILAPATSEQGKALRDDARLVSPDPADGRPGPPDSSGKAVTDGTATDGAATDGAAAEGAAATTVVVGDPPHSRARVHLGTGAWDALTDEGRRVVLTHECVHVALSAQPRPDAPRWFVEGVAEYVAYRDSPVSLEDVWEPLREKVTRDGVPDTLPAADDFEPVEGTRPRSLEQRRLTYAEASSAAATYARLHGESALVGLVVTGPPGGGRDRDAYGRSQAELLPAWQADLRRGSQR